MAGDAVLVKTRVIRIRACLLAVIDGWCHARYRFPVARSSQANAIMSKMFLNSGNNAVFVSRKKSERHSNERYTRLTTLMVCPGAKA